MPQEIYQEPYIRGINERFILKCFGKYTDSTRQNIYNYIREGIFPKPRIKKRGNYKFSNREIFQFVRYGILPEHLDGNES